MSEGKLSEAEKYGLSHVAAGKVIRLYRKNGSVINCGDTVRPQTIWRLIRKGFVTDGLRSDGGVFETRCQQVLTDAGRTALRKALGEPESPK